MVVRGGELRTKAKWVKGVKRYKLPVIEYISPGDVMCSVVTLVNNTVSHI